MKLVLTTAIVQYSRCIQNMLIDTSKVKTENSCAQRRSYIDLELK